MATINTQIILFQPQFYLEQQLLYFLTHKEKVSYRFNENCWITYFFAKTFHFFKAQQGNITAIIIITPPKLFNHPTLGLYSILTAAVFSGCNKELCDFMVAKNDTFIFNPEERAALVSFHHSLENKQ